VYTNYTVETFLQYRQLGRSGLKVSELSFGSWVTFGKQLDESQAREVMSYAYDMGVNFFDNAEVYAQGESERIMGKALQALGWSRDSYIVSSKVFWGGERPTQRGLSRKHVVEGCHAALKRLQVDYLDLFFCHRPDPDTPVAETVFTMDSLIRQGKILYWGTSEWPADHINQAYLIAQQNGLHPPTMEQPQYNLLHRQRVEEEYASAFDQWGLGATTWSPLASGILTGKYNDGVPDGSRAALEDFGWLKERILSDAGKKEITKVKQLGEVAADCGMSLAQFSIAWCLKNKNVSTVILGATKLEQLEATLEASPLLVRINEEVMNRCDQILSDSDSGPA
jgi:voltage-dependent potassium channel beta subunit